MNKVQQQLRGSSHKSRWVCRPQSCWLKGKAAWQSSAAPATHSTPGQGDSEGLSTGSSGAGRCLSPWEAGQEQISPPVAVGQARRERRNTKCLPERCEESPCPGAGLCVLLESPSHHPRGREEEEEEGREEEEEHQATWLQFQLLSPLHNFCIFSAITMGFSLRIFSAASAL